MIWVNKVPRVPEIIFGKIMRSIAHDMMPDSFSNSMPEDATPKEMEVRNHITKRK